jgi:hypothetical protein
MDCFRIKPIIIPTTTATTITSTDKKLALNISYYLLCAPLENPFSDFITIAVID